jgi:hypothetical protein
MSEKPTAGEGHEGRHAFAQAARAGDGVGPLGRYGFGFLPTEGMEGPGTWNA